MAEIVGIIDQTLIDKAVAATKIEGSGTNGDFDPNMFLKILMEQLKNQNPFDSVDSAEIMQQQAMLTQVEQVTRQTESMEDVKQQVEENFTSIAQTLSDIRSVLVQINNK